ncbi:TetR/AcrR family transcriptional regulator [Skermania sp. ID1734]|nr:TetR/AcrR family transcriptional regulator [Skermania sp. ID1734]
MLFSAVELLRERGAAAVTIDAVLARSGAPRGSVYHHFPGGRSEMMTDALTLAGDAIGSIIERAASEGSTEALRRFHDFWSKTLHDSDFNAGCPVLSVAVGAAPDDLHLQPTVTEIFERWHDTLVSAIAADGVDPARAGRLATMAIAAMEGAVVLSRVRRSTEPLDDVIGELEALFADATTGALPG